MTQKPHPQRCNRTDCWAYKEGFCYAMCASHSSQQSERDTKMELKKLRNILALQKENESDIRGKVLEEVRSACIKDETVGYTIFRILQELRSKQGEQR